MSPTQKKRFIFVVILVFSASIATALVIYGLNQNLLYFYSPTQVMHGKVPSKMNFRLGGLVVPGSITKESDSMKIYFKLTDNNSEIQVSYKGLLPDLFREGQGIVTLGYMDDSNIFHADQVLAKHDENYMPPEVAELLVDENKNKPIAIPQ